MTSDWEKSFKAKVRTIAQEQHREPADVWQYLALERFLARLACSSYRDYFILKGAVLLSKYIILGRETRDLDFLGRSVSNSVASLKGIFEELAAISLTDGFVFQNIEATELTHPHMNYVGAEITMMAYLGKTRIKISIDIGFGDLVEPIPKMLPLTTYSKGPLFEDSIEIMCYPKEFIFAEKLETIVYRGAVNSRMKFISTEYCLLGRVLSRVCS